MDKILYWCLLLIVFVPCFLVNEAWIIERAAVIILISFITFFVKKKFLYLNKIDLFLAVFLGFSIISAFFRDNIYESLYSVFWFLSMFSASIIFKNLKYSCIRRKIIFFIYFFDLIVIADYFNIFNYLYSFFKYGFLSQRGVLSDSSLWFINGNMLGNMLLFAAIPGILYAERLKRFYLYGIFHAFSIFLTGNFTALFIFIALHLFSISKNINYRKFLLISGILSGLVFTVFLINSEKVNSSLYHRKILYTNGIEQFKDNIIFGSGLGLFRYNYYRYLNRSSQNPDFDYLPPSHYVHNDYIQIIAENGLAGLLLILVLMFYIYRNIGNNRIFYLFALIMTGFMQHGLYSEKAFFVFIVLLCSYRFKKEFKIKSLYIKILILSLLFYFVFTFTGALGFEYAEKPQTLKNMSVLRPGYSFLYTNTALAYERNSDFMYAEYFYKKSIEYDKYWGEHYFRYGRFLIKKENIIEALKNYKFAIKYNSLRRKFDIAQEGLFFAHKFKLNEEFEWFYKSCEKNIYFEDQRLHFESIKKRLKNN